MSFDAIILAAGKSNRMSQNKLTHILGNQALILQTINAFEGFSEINKILLVTDNLQIKQYVQDKPNLIVTKGGATRAQSVHNALKICSSPFTLIHDGARPFVSKELIERVMTATKKHNSAIPTIPVSDSLRLIKNNRIIEYANRDDFCSVQTPQGFNRKQILLAYDKLENQVYTDDSQVYGKFISPPFIVKGQRQNIKITYDEDLFGINAKVGMGYDMHKLKEDLPLILGGEVIPFEKGLEAHSDGDVVIHAIMDSLLGAASKGDIGYHFPPFEEKYKNISSLKLLNEVSKICDQKGVKINNINAVIIAQRPKVCSYIPKMRENIANTLKIDINIINISATTTEGLGELGEEKAIACMAVSSCF